MKRARTASNIADGNYSSCCEFGGCWFELLCGFGAGRDGFFGDFFFFCRPPRAPPGVDDAPEPFPSSSKQLIEVRVQRNHKQEKLCDKTVFFILW